MSRVVHFEVMADDPTRASEFYQNVFGWEISMGWAIDARLVTTGSAAQPGIGYMVYCLDTEGVMFGMMQMDTSTQ